MSESFEFDNELIAHIAEDRNKEAKSMLNQDLVKASDDYGTLLHYAAEFDNNVIARELIILGAEVNRLGKGDQTPLMIATYNENIATMKVLLEGGADFNIVDSYGESALEYALKVSEDAPKVTEAFVRHIQNHSYDDFDFFIKLVRAGFTLHHAVHIENVEVLKGFLQRGIPIDSVNNYNETALHVAVRIENLEMTKLLIDRGADVNILDEDAVSILSSAAFRMNSNIMSVLLKYGANPNSQSYNGFTPLLDLYFNRETDREKQFDGCVAILLQHGAYPQKAFFVEKTVLDFALDRKRSNGVDCLVAHLAILEMNKTQNMELIEEFKEVSVRSNGIKLDENFKLCQKILKTEVFGKLTLLDLLTISNYEMRFRVRNKAFVSKIHTFCSEQKLDKLYPYYYLTLMKRIFEAIPIVKLEDEVLPIICGIFQKNYNEFYVPAKKVVGYLDECDLKQLCTL